MVSQAAMEIAMQTLKDGLEGRYAELRTEFGQQVNRIDGNINALDAKVIEIANNVTRESETFATKVREIVTSLDQSRARMDEQLNIMAARAESFRSDAAELQNKVDAEFQKMMRAQEENSSREQQAQDNMRQVTEATFNEIQGKCKASIEDKYARIQDFSNTVDRSVNHLAERIGSMGTGPAPAPGGESAQGRPNQQGFDAFAGARDGNVPTYRMDGDMPRGDRRNQIRGLIHHSELKVEKLPEEVKRDQFILWRDQLEESLEQTPGFSGATAVFETIRRCKGLVQNISVAQIESWDGSDFDQASVAQIREMSRQLFGGL